MGGTKYDTKYLKIYKKKVEWSKLPTAPEICEIVVSKVQNPNMVNQLEKSDHY